MRKLVLVVVTLISHLAFSAEQKTISQPPPLKRIDENRIALSIYTPKEQGVQAATYVTGEELRSVIALLLQDPATPLAKLKKDIETENCPDSKPEDIEADCGVVQFTVSPMTSFGRGGWMDAGATWTTFVGFREKGTGRFFEARYGFRINEEVDAMVDSEGDYTGELVKTYTFVDIAPFPAFTE